MTADELIAYLNLVPLPGEGGFFRENHRSVHSTAIYYLLSETCHSRLHRLTGDEVYHFYLGDPVELLTLHPDGSGAVTILGPDVKAGQQMQKVVPAGMWQGSRLIPGGRVALLGTTMAPPFEVSGFTLGQTSELTAAYPEFAEQITFLTQENT